MRRSAAIAIVALMSLSAQASESLPLERCGEVSAASRERLVELDHGYTQTAAEKANYELARRISGPPGEHLAADPDTEVLMARQRGWLLKKKWLVAIARREHDGDEAGAYCGFLKAEARKKP